MTEEVQLAPVRRGVLRSLGFKLTVTAAVVMLVFAWARPKISNLIFGGTAFLDNPQAHIEERVLTAALGEPNGSAADEVRQYFAQVVQEEGRHLYLVDRAGRIVLRSTTLEECDDADLSRGRDFRLAVDGQVRGHASCAYTPLFEDGELRGFRVAVFSMPLGESEELDPEFEGAPILAVAHDSPLLLRPPTILELISRVQRRWRWTSNFVDVAVAIVTALLLGFAAMLIVTRPLRRLVRQVERGDVDELGLPGPFHEPSRDEIGLLSRALNGMRARIAQLVEHLKRRDEQRREWIAQVSHDIRTPLTSLTVCLDRAQGSFDRGATSETNSALASARHDTRRIRALVDDLFEIARLEIGNELDIEPIPPQELVADVCRSLRPQAEQRGIELEQSPTNGVPELLGDGHRLLRACENLLSNAIRHARSKVRVGTEGRDGSVRVWVSDDGDGFEGGRGTVDLDAVRRRSEQAESSGLGLLVARRVAEAHGGTLHAENCADGWTRVCLDVPAATT